MQHQVLGDDIEDVFFSWRFLHRHQPTQFRNPLIEVKVGQPLARREPGFRLLARVGDRVGGQVECFHRAFGEVSRLQERLLCLQVIGGVAARFLDLLEGHQRWRFIVEQQGGAADVLRRDVRDHSDRQQTADQDQPSDAPFGAPDHPPEFQKINRVLVFAVLLMQMRLQRTFDVGARAVVHD
ncbi:hypothetical protein D3C87_1394440 [compost metagenome]